MTLSWMASGAGTAVVTSYRLMLKGSDAGVYQTLASVPASLQLMSVSVELPSLTTLNWAQAKVKVQACDAANACVDSNEQPIASILNGAIGYFKASNPQSFSNFGFSMAMSADGTTMVVGAPVEGTTASASGAVYVFVKTIFGWSQQAMLKASNPGQSDWFGTAVSLSSDGNVLAVGAPFERSNATGINGDQLNDLARNSGAVYVFTRSATTWSAPIYVKASNTRAEDNFGISVAVSGDGKTLAVGAPFEDSGAINVDGNENDTSVADAGAVYVYDISNGVVTKKNYLKAAKATASSYFGSSLSLSADGNMLAIGQEGESTEGPFLPGSSVPNSGAVYLYPRVATQWRSPAIIKAFNIGRDSFFGNSVSLSADGKTLAVGSSGEASNATGVINLGGQIPPSSLDTSKPLAGATYVYSVDTATVSATAYIKASHQTTAAARFGSKVTLSGDGTTLIVGAYRDSSNATGVNGNQLDPSAPSAGAAYTFEVSNGTWAQRAYVKAANTAANDNFGYAHAVSSDGKTLAISAVSEDSAATGINGSQTDNNATDAGAVYLY